MDAAVARALAYPYDIPDHSYVFDPSSGVARSSPTDELRSLCVDRVPVLAAGSNAAPEQLRRKFPADGTGRDPIPVVRADVDGLDVVFAAKIASYGAVPATPHDVTGTVAHLHLTFLTSSQLEIMHASEGLGDAYVLEELDPRRVSSPVGLATSVLRYAAARSALLVEGQPVALRRVRSRGRRLKAWTQIEMLTHVGRLVDLGAEELVRRSVRDPGFRGVLNDRLARLAEA